MATHQSWQIPYRCYLNAAGEAQADTISTIMSTEQLVQAYQHMVLVRAFDKKVVALQRTGQMGTYPSSLGQEAIGTAIGYAMLKEDILVPYYRDQATQLLRGVTMGEIMLYWGGHERGSCFTGPQQDFPICIPIASQLPHASGVASAIKIRKQKRVVVTTCGDGATSKGDFSESLNLAGVWQLPLVVVVNNNQWAISVPRAIQTRAPTLAQKAVAAGISAEQVDGNDLVAVFSAVTQALQKARSGKGPHLIEAISYRLSNHTTADDASRYRSAEELNQAWQQEPVSRLKAYLEQQEQWDHTREQALQQQVEEKIQQAVAHYLAVQPEPVSTMFDYLYQDLPASLKLQKDELLARQATNQEGQQDD
jgi:pyruvate dehydrogenase E1 component alpha subunit